MIEEPTCTAVIVAARGLAAQRGWDAVRMGHVAQAARVSRQTVYNLFGSKQGLAQQVVAAELAVFMDGISSHLGGHAGDTETAIAGAVRWVLDTAAANPLLQRILSSQPQPDGLLPALTTDGTTIVSTATAVLRPWLAQQLPHVPDAQIDLAVSTVVRLTLSYLVLPAPGADVPGQVAGVAAAIAGGQRAG